MNVVMERIVVLNYVGTRLVLTSVNAVLASLSPATVSTVQVRTTLSPDQVVGEVLFCYVLRMRMFYECWLTL